MTESKSDNANGIGLANTINREDFKHGKVFEQSSLEEASVEFGVPSDQMIDATVKMAKARYVGALNYFYEVCNSSAMSKRNVLRAVVSAIDIGVTDSKVKFQRKEEAELAGLLAQVIDLSMIIKADNLKKKEGDKNGKANDSATEEN